MPKIDTTVTFIVPQSKSKDSPEGKKFVRGEADDAPLTLGYALASMLFNASMMDDKGATAGKKKFDRYKLAEKFSDADDAGETVEVTPEQLTDIRALFGDSYATAIVGQAWPHLNGETK